MSVSGAFSITTTSLPDGLVGEVYRQSLTASGGREPYVWSIESGSLPDGLSLSSEGEISGTPGQVGDFDFTVQVTDTEARTATKELSIHVEEESPYIPTYYVDATNGDDDNDGRSPEQAWQSLAKVSETSFEPGDVIAFKRGEVWQGRLTISSSGTEDAPIVFTAYGSGEKPVIRDIFQQDLSWSSYSTNIWRAPVSHRIQRLWEGETELHRAYILDPFEDLGESFRFGWQDGYLYLYKTSEPSPSDYSFYKMGSAIYLSGQRYVVIDNLDAQGGETCLLADSCQYVTVTNCNIGKDAFVGIDVGGDSEGSAAHNKILHNTIDSNWTFDDTDAYVGRNSDSRGCEDGIHITHYGYDIEIADNTFKDWGHSHIYLYDSRSDGIYDISIHHNHFSTENADYGKGFDVLGNVHDVELAYNHFYKVTGGSDFNGHDNHFHHNLMEETKHYGIRGGSGRNGNALNTNNGAGDVFNNVIESNIFCYSDSEGITVNAYSTHGYVSHDITIRHNILYKNGENSISGVDSPSLSIWNTEYLSNVTVESNIIVHAGSSNMIRYNGTTFSSIAAFEDAQVDGDVLRDNSDSDPLFVSETDYTLQSGSPAADFDIDVSQIGPRY